jgi:anti-anti-sigma regulatory factor
MDEDGMQMSSEHSSGYLDLGEILVISDAMEWYQKIIAVFEGATEIQLDGGRIEQIDGIGLQLLVAIFKQAAVKGVRVVWKGVSDTLLISAGQLGLIEILRLDLLVDEEPA